MHTTVVGESGATYVIEQCGADVFDVYVRLDSGTLQLVSENCESVDEARRKIERRESLLLNGFSVL